jgi:hypothetical protein
MRKEGETCGLGRASIRDSTQGSKKVASVQQKGERGWVRPHVTHLLQKMEVLTEVLPRTVPCTSSLQENHAESPTHQKNLHTPIQYSRGSATPGASHAELKRRVTGEQREDLIKTD